MSLSCLNCPSSQRTNSDLDSRHDSYHEKMHRIDEERNWSGPLCTPPLDRTARNGPLGAGVRTKSHRGHPRLMFASGEMGLGRGKMGTGNAGEPRLIRSSGMRRDWSFEDLRQRRDGKMRKNSWLLHTHSPCGTPDR